MDMNLCLVRLFLSGAQDAVGGADAQNRPRIQLQLVKKVLSVLGLNWSSKVPGLTAVNFSAAELCVSEKYGEQHK